MPPNEVYRVKFANGNLHPDWNSYGWDDMRLSKPTPNDFAESWPDYAGLNLRISRGAGVPQKVAATNNVFLVFQPGDLPLDIRLMMRLEFDLPKAESFWSHHPAGTRVGSKTPTPEPWAVGLGVKLSGTENDSATDRSAAVTCQFNQDLNGVRLNTPTGLQRDRSVPLDGPLSYSRYGGPQSEFLDGFVHPPRFILEHVFCGYNAAAVAPGVGHTPGSGRLTIREALSLYPDKTDVRVYSTSVLSQPGEINTSISALGASLVSTDGVGRMSVRFRSFSLSILTGTGPP